jgi:hypothetical protein
VYLETDGELIGLTYQREQQVTAWHRQIFGGKFGECYLLLQLLTYTNIATWYKNYFSTKSDGTTTTFTSATGTAYYRKNFKYNIKQ